MGFPVVVNTRTSSPYFTSNGKPYSTVVNPNDALGPGEVYLNDIDRSRQPQDSAFITKELGALKAQIVDNGDGEFTGNYGRGVSIVRSANASSFKRFNTWFRLFDPVYADEPFLVFGTNTKIRGGNRRLSGSVPFKRPTQLQQIAGNVNLYELADPRNPFSPHRVGSFQTTQYFTETQDAQFIVKEPAPNRFLRPVIERSFESKWGPGATLLDSHDPTWEVPFVQSIKMERTADGMGMELTAFISNDVDANGIQQNTVTYSIAWGDAANPGDDQMAVASGVTTAKANPYPADGIYEIVVAANPIPGRTIDTTPRVHKVFMRGADWKPTPLAWVDVTVTDPVAPSREGTIDVKVRSTPAVVLLMDPGYEGGVLPTNFLSYEPVSYDWATQEATFQIKHEFPRGGSFMCILRAEQLIHNKRVEMVTDSLLGDDVPMFSATESYQIGDRVKNAVNVFEANVANMGPFNGAEWTVIGPVDANVNRVYGDATSAGREQITYIASVKIS